VLDAATDELGDNGRVGLDYKELPRDVRSGDVLLLDDGKIVLDVKDVRGAEIHPSLATGERFPTTRASIRQAAGSPRRRSRPRTSTTSAPPRA
jgi:pyruvate kinase